MESYCEKLDDLLEIKQKKRSPNKTEKQAFESALACLIIQDGFSGQAEKFLYDGIPFCGAGPFKEYLGTAGDTVKALESLYNGDLYQSNCAGRTTLLIHLLALSLNDPEMDRKAIVSLIQHIPSAVKNSKGQIYGRIDGVLKKYFLDELINEAEFPDCEELTDLGLDLKDLNAFSNAVNSAFVKLDKSKLPLSCQNNIHRVCSWLCLPERTAGETSGTGTGNGSVEQSDYEKDQETLDLEKKLDEAEKTRRKLEDEVNKTCGKVDELEATIRRLTGELEGKDTRLQSLLSERTHLNTQMSELNESIRKYQNEVMQCNEMIEMLRRDRTRQSDEGMRRLANELKAYYQDYQDAKDLEMSIELGENIRDQFGEVLNMLSSAGLSDK